MAALVWDKTGERYFEAGVDHGVLYVQKRNAETGAMTYDKGVAWNGLISVQESPDGAEPNDLWADNIKYATLRSAETFGATIEAYTYPEEFMECDGTHTITKGVYIGQQSRNAFGFVYRTKVGNDTSSDINAGYKIHIIYNATASPSDRSYESINDSPDAITMSWEVDTTPVAFEDEDHKDFKPVATIVIDSTKLNSDGLSALQQLENTLFGTADKEPSLPSPDDVVSMFEDGGSITPDP